VFNFENTRTGTTSSVQGASPTAPLDEQGNPIRERRREDLDKSAASGGKK
jgi:hypothetical protein